jgi:2-aminoadipate transaminase
MPQYASRVEYMKQSAAYLRGLFSNMTDPNMINLGGGSPAKEALPAETLRELAVEVLSDPRKGSAALQYSSTQGLAELREAVVNELLRPKGVTDQSAENVLIVNGGLETMNLVCQVFIQPGDVILLENPAFIHCVEIFEMFQARCIPCACDEAGLVMEDVEAKIREYHPKMVYTVPTFNNPTGKTLPLERRRKLAELGSQYDVIILEDDPYRDIRYSGEELPPIKSFDKTGHTIMANSFSKIFSPGARLGYAVATQEIIAHMMDAKIATNSHTSTLCQMLAAEFFNRGFYPAHHKKICDLYRSRRDVMLAAIDKYFPEGTRHTMPDGGFYTWVELPEGMDATALAPVANQMGIAYLPGEAWHRNGGREGKNTLRMCFSSTPEDKIEYAVKTLGRLFCENR